MEEKVQMNIPTLKEAFADYVNSTYKNCSPKSIIEKFEEAAQHPFTEKNITDYNLKRFAKWLSENRSPGTARTYSAVLKAFINVSDFEFPSKNYKKILSLERDEPETTYLDEDDIRKFLSYKPRTDSEYYTQRLFFICLMTGCRKSDGMLITASRVRDNKFTYVAKKTGKKSSEMYIPDSILDILNDRKYKELQKRGFSDTAYNEAVRTICKNVGIVDEITLYKCGKYVTKPKYEFFASHSARRSAATNMYNRDPSSLLNISRMLGHTSVAQTQRYIRCSEGDTEAMMDFKTSFRLK